MSTQRFGHSVELVIDNDIYQAYLNSSLTAKSFMRKLPLTFSMTRYEHDFCGEASSLPTEPEDLHPGWKNGDIGYGGGWFSLLLSGEEISSAYQDMMIIGKLDDNALERLRVLSGSITVMIRRPHSSVL
ncbi:TPA: hypothetical protein JG922_000465 [Enterobacter hormaechei subsp. steigerwaltii]|nr:hypothetical protein [Enterobacter hormaechei subsp. steigerwaltii]